MTPFLSPAGWIHNIILLLHSTANNVWRSHTSSSGAHRHMLSCMLPFILEGGGAFHSLCLIGAWISCRFPANWVHNLPPPMVETVLSPMVETVPGRKCPFSCGFSAQSNTLGFGKCSTLCLPWAHWTAELKSENCQNANHGKKKIITRSRWGKMDMFHLPWEIYSISHVMHRPWTSALCKQTLRRHMPQD